ncbi:MAG: recombinase family protein [Oscillospiraceae bacterium]|jgi:DNA invertase Pin-like site-specific DNA recombinase|nr:recombinase family protein [Oscillospiraceae bacterium]
MKQRDITAALYLRLSRDDGGDAESNSIGNQRDILHRYASENGLLIHDEYVDDGWSGTSFERPSFKRMVSDIEDGKVGIVLCKDLSRLGRNNALVAFYTELFFPDHDVRLIALNDSIDTGHGENEIMAFKSVINEYYARDISKKIRSVRRNQALKGEFSGSHAPYGYIKSPEDKHKLIIDEEAAIVVRRMFQMAADSLGVHQIAQALAEEKVLVPTMYKYLQLGYKSNRFDENYPYDWRATTVKRLLESRVYVGDIVSHKCGNKSFKNQKLITLPESEWIVVEDMHEPIVTRDVFEKVQRLIKTKKRANAAHIDNIFAGILKCADCGGGMNFHSHKSANPCGRFLCNRYRHSSSTDLRKSCTSHYVPYANIYTATLLRLNQIIAANLNEEDVVRQLMAGCDSSKAAKKMLAKLKHRNGELDHIIRKIVEQNALGEITVATFSKLYSGYINEQETLSEKIAALEAELSAENRDRENARLFIAAVRKYSPIEELSRELLLDLIDHIVVHEATGDRRAGTREQALEFHYRFIGKLPECVVPNEHMTSVP